MLYQPTHITGYDTDVKTPVWVSYTLQSGVRVSQTPVWVSYTLQSGVRVSQTPVLVSYTLQSGVRVSQTPVWVSYTLQRQLAPRSQGTTSTADVSLMFLDRLQ